MPLWLAESLAKDRVALVLPLRAFSARVASDLEAGPEALALRELSPYFYRLGEKYSKLYTNIHERSSHTLLGHHRRESVV